MGFWVSIQDNTHDQTEYDVQSVHERMDNGFRAELVVRVPFSERLAKAAEFKGGLQANGTLLRPQQYGPYRLAVCTSVDISVPSPLAIAAADVPTVLDPWQTLQDDLALLTVTFETVEYEGSTQPANRINVLEQMQGAAEFLTLPNGELYWDAAHTLPLDASQAPGFLKRMKTWEITLKDCQTTLPAGIFGNQGCVNNDTIKSFKYGETFQPGTLLWGKPDVGENSPTDGVTSCDIVIPLTHDPLGWNNFHGKPGTALSVASPIYSVTSGSSPEETYPGADFRTTLTMFPEG